MQQILNQQSLIPSHTDFLTLLQVVPQIIWVTDFVMTVTIHLKAILMVETAVHLMKILSMGVGINIVPYVNVFSPPLARTIGPQKNATRNAMQKNV